MLLRFRSRSLTALFHYIRNKSICTDQTLGIHIMLLLLTREKAIKSSYSNIFYWPMQNFIKFVSSNSLHETRYSRENAKNLLPNAKHLCVITCKTYFVCNLINVSALLDFILHFWKFLIYLLSLNALIYSRNLQPGCHYWFENLSHDYANFLFCFFYTFLLTQRCKLIFCIVLRKIEFLYSRTLRPTTKNFVTFLA